MLSATGRAGASSCYRRSDVPAGQRLMLSIVWLAGAVALLLVAHHRIRPMYAVASMVAVGLITRTVHLDESRRALHHLWAPLGFLAAAVPLAVLLDHVGFFDALAERVGTGGRLMPTLWVLAALVTTVLNLDASIVLLTPLYLRIARRHGMDPLRLAFIPVLLASLASSALPVSNLTNLIVAERNGTSTWSFIAHLAPASIAASIVGWFAYRRFTRGPINERVAPEPASEPTPSPAEQRRALRVGAPAVVALLVGFVLGDSVGIPAWAVAAAVVVALVLLTRRVPWRSIPVEALVVAAGLAILSAAASPHLSLDHLLHGTGVGADVRAAASATVGANAINNIPALLVGLPHVSSRSSWAYLAGVNFGPVLWVYGSLAGLLWMDLVRAGGVEMSPRSYARAGIRVGVPALAIAFPIALFTNALLA